MAAPTDIPFWEVAKGGGPITNWHNGRLKNEAEAFDRRERLRKPHKYALDYVREKRKEVSIERRKSVSGRTYQQRRALGLCTVCEAPSKPARCEKCWARYYEMPCRVKLRK